MSIFRSVAILLLFAFASDSALGGDVQDFASSAVLRKLPSVTKVDLRGAKESDVRLVHVLDWHFVPEELFILDVQQQAQGKLSKEQVEALYAEHLKDVDDLQREHMEVLRTLISRHGLKAVFIEGLTDAGTLLFDARVAAFRELKKENRACRCESTPLAMLLLFSCRCSVAESPAGARLLRALPRPFRMMQATRRRCNRRNAITGSSTLFRSAVARF